MKLIIPNTCKTSYTSSDYGFMRLVHWRNNPNRKTLIYMPYVSRHCSLSSHNPNCKTDNELLINILLLLLVRPIYLGMYPGVHLNAQTSIYELGEWLLENCWRLMDHIYSGSHLCPRQRHTTIHPYTCRLILGIKTPNTNRQFCDYYKYNVTPVSISSSYPDVSCPFYDLLGNYQCTGTSRSMSGVS